MAGPGAGSEVLLPIATLDCPILAHFAGFVVVVVFK